MIQFGEKAFRQITIVHGKPVPPPSQHRPRGYITTGTHFLGPKITRAISHHVYNTFIRTHIHARAHTHTHTHKYTTTNTCSILDE